MKKKLLTITLLAFCLGFISNPSFAQVQDNAIDDVGDIAFVAYATTTTNGITGFAFVLLDNCPNNTSIYFTDDEWQGGPSFSTGEGDLTWTNNTGSTISKGTVIKICGTTANVWTSVSVNTGSVNVGNTAFSTANGDQIYAMTGNRTTPGTFLAFVGGITTTSLSFNNTPFGSGTAPSASLTGYGVNITSGSMYTGSTVCNSTVTACNTMVNTAGSWGPTGFTGLSSSAAFFGAIPSFFTGSVLPVELTSFTVTTEGGKNHLTWATASETNNKGFDIERSRDGETFQAIGTVKAIGKAGNYNFTDAEPVNGTNYYRLRQIDNDGTETYSKVVSVNNKGGKSLKVYPTLVSNGVLTVDTEGGDYAIYNIVGQQVQSGKTTQRLDVSTLAKGTYILKVGTEQVKFTKL